MPEMTLREKIIATAKQFEADIENGLDLDGFDSDF